MTCSGSDALLRDLIQGLGRQRDTSVVLASLLEQLGRCDRRKPLVFVKIQMKPWRLRNRYITDKDPIRKRAKQHRTDEVAALLDQHVGGQADDEHFVAAENFIKRNG